MFTTISYFAFLFLLFIHIVQSAIPAPNHPQIQSTTNAAAIATTTSTAAATIAPAIASSPATTTQQKPVYNIGIIFPNTTVVKADDPTLGDMIITCELAIKLAAESIQQNNILPGNDMTYDTSAASQMYILNVGIIDVDLNFTRYYSDELNPGRTSWVSVSMVEKGVE